MPLTRRESFIDCRDSSSKKARFSFARESISPLTCHLTLLSYEATND